MFTDKDYKEPLNYIPLFYGQDSHVSRLCANVGL